MPLNSTAKTLGGLCFQLLRGGARAATELQGAPVTKSISSQRSPAGPARGPKSRPRKGRTQGSRDSAGPGRWRRFSVQTGDKAFHFKSFFLKKINTIDFGSWKKYPRGERPWSLCPAERLRDPSGILGWFQVAQPEATSAVIRTAGQARHVVPPGTLSGPILTGKGWRAIVTGSLWTLVKGSAGFRHPLPRSPAASWPELKRQAGGRADVNSGGIF